ncbi:LamG domain-containing protein [Calothrix sp. NIES-2100]|uniref:LamG-like jellyroll fold domain-containing protein n=1 Tax=Calothrix sp. NIES-2100 TaxID=1954172 RepID=UPI000B5E86CF|nr:LamG domain-containing protein [Calothrix sp. NIES-2100]
MTEPKKSWESVIAFDGQHNWINLGKKPEFKIAKEITLEAWIYCQNQRRRTGIVSNVFDTTTTQSGYGLLLDGKSGIFFALKTGSKRIQYLSSNLDSIKLNQWHHIAGTYDGQQMIVYIDGEKKATKAIADSLIDYEPENDLLIGTYKDNNETYPFLGKIAEVRIWSVALSQQQIQQNTNKYLTGNESGLIGYWRLNEGDGNTAYDHTANANHGIININNWVKSQLPITNITNSKLGVTTNMSKEKKATPKTETDTTAPSADKNQEIQSHLLSTGLEDYGFWWQQMAKDKANQSEPEKPFRRGRIWA